MGERRREGTRKGKRDSEERKGEGEGGTGKRGRAKGGERERESGGDREN
jgi:hypothetical protein